MLFAQGSICNARKYVLGLSLLAAGVSFAPGAAFAADAGASTYQQERAACLSGQSHQDRETCLKEAAAARGEARRGNLNGGTTSYEQNAVTRCNALPAADRPDCVRRVTGGGTVSGSVESGGVYRETTTTIVAPPAASAAPGSEYQPMPMPMHERMHERRYAPSPGN